jgi:hypothetical protein
MHVTRTAARTSGSLGDRLTVLGFLGVVLVGLPLVGFLVDRISQNVVVHRFAISVVDGFPRPTSVLIPADV